ncbi:MAG TPA: FAD/NAD(P)-binding oxidoreductase [Blastocatellia bacterium]|nr:FAD/NAD(P)-binding oxidoreductase [Blastocatellia bacterium]
MDRKRLDCDILIIGGGPAGLAAASSAAKNGRSVSIIDDNPNPGGQIWRGESSKSSIPQAAALLNKVKDLGVDFIGGARVFDQPEDHLLLAESLNDVLELQYSKLIIATGARERFLPFPGWTLPNVMGAGGLQALVKSGMPIDGKLVIIAGSGPLLLAVASYLYKHDAKIVLIAEQTSRSNLLKFGLGLIGQPDKILQAIDIKKQLFGVPYKTNCWPVSAHGHGKLESVKLKQDDRTFEIDCDYLACGFHLIPNLELPALLGCETDDGVVKTDQFQQTSVPDIYCAGESTAIGGLDLSLVEGEIAGYAATGNEQQAEHLFNSRQKHRKFADLLNRTFELRDELKALPDQSTIVCRCEDVTFDRLRQYNEWRAAKLHTRCGMGPCQGRICGPAVEFFLGWKPESVRPPIFPARLDNLIRVATASAEVDTVTR